LHVGHLRHKCPTWVTDSFAAVSLAHVAIEVKAGRNVSLADTRGLQSLETVVRKHPPLLKWIIYRGERKQRFDNGVEVWPVLEALAALQ